MLSPVLAFFRPDQTQLALLPHRFLNLASSGRFSLRSRGPD
jgi:hypothetical protein